MMNKPDKTKKYLIAITIGAITLAFSPVFSLGDQNVGEKASAEAHSAEHKVKKGAHHASEAHCKDGAASCAGQKVKHRAHEAGDTVSDEAKKAKDKAD